MKETVNLKDISFCYPNKSDTLKNLNLSLEPGSITGLLGRNGSGKSTLMQILLGLLKPQTGEAMIFGQPITTLPSALRKRIGYVPQVETPFSWMRLDEALEMIASFYDNWDQALIKRYLTEWNLHKFDYIDEMSAGQQQMAAILMAIGHHPDLLVLDEPVASLDPTTRRQFLQAVVELNQDLNKTILFSSHIVSDLERIASHVAILHKRVIQYHGSLDHLKESHVRLTFYGDNLPEQLPVDVPQLRNYRHKNTFGTAFGINWDSSQSEELSSKLGLRVNEEPLQLEELFMELTNG